MCGRTCELRHHFMPERSGENSSPLPISTSWFIVWIRIAVYAEPHPQGELICPCSNSATKALRDLQGFVIIID